MSINLPAINLAIDKYKDVLMTQPAPADTAAQGQMSIATSIKQHLINGRERERSKFNTAAIKVLLVDIAAALDEPTH